MKKTGIETLDSRGRINLAKYTTPDDRVYIMKRHADGKIVLTPAVVVPKNEKTAEPEHGGFAWGQRVRVKKIPSGNPTGANRVGRIEGFQLHNSMVANVRFTDNGNNVVYAYHVRDLESL